MFYLEIMKKFRFFYFNRFTRTIGHNNITCLENLFRFEFLIYCVIIVQMRIRRKNDRPLTDKKSCDDKRSNLIAYRLKIQFQFKIDAINTKIQNKT